MGKRQKVCSHSGPESPLTASMGSYRVSTPESTEKHNGSSVVNSTPRKGASRAAAAGLGLRDISSLVWKTLERKGTATYTEIANDVVAEVSVKEDQETTPSSSDSVRRRVYDALNVFDAMDIVTKVDKAYKWKGATCKMDIEETKKQHLNLSTRIQQKADYLKELEEQMAGLRLLVSRNKKSVQDHNAPREGFTLPFMMVQTKPHATVEIEISEDMQLVHFDFNSTPFSLHDDANILRLIREHEQESNRMKSRIHSSSGRYPGRNT